MITANQIEGDNEPQPSIPHEDGQVPFVFIGTIESISNAKVLLEYHLVHLKVGVAMPFSAMAIYKCQRFSLCIDNQEVELLRQEKLEIDQQLRAIQGNSSMSSMPNFTVQRRSDRGYSSDVDTMRPNARGANASTSHQGNPPSAGGSVMRGRGGRGRSNNTRFHSGKCIHKKNPVFLCPLVPICIERANVRILQCCPVLSRPRCAHQKQMFSAKVA